MLRVVALGSLLVIPAVLIDPVVLADTLIERWKLPYHLVDTTLLGERSAP